MSDLVWICTTVECGMETDTDYFSIPREDWDGMSEKQQSDYLAESAVEHQNNFAPCGGSVVEETDVPDSFKGSSE